MSLKTFQKDFCVYAVGLTPPGRPLRSLWFTFSSVRALFLRLSWIFLACLLSSKPCSFSHTSVLWWKVLGVEMERRREIQRWILKNFWSGKSDKTYYSQVKYRVQVVQIETYGQCNRTLWPTWHPITISLRHTILNKPPLAHPAQMSTVLRLRNPALTHRKENTQLGQSNWGKSLQQCSWLILLAFSSPDSLSLLNFLSGRPGSMSGATR